MNLAWENGALIVLENGAFMAAEDGEVPVVVPTVPLEVSLFAQPRRRGKARKLGAYEHTGALFALGELG